MRESIPVGRSVLPAPLLVAVLGLVGCDGSMGSSASSTFSLPAPRGGLAPVEGLDLLDPAFASAGTLERADFLERAPLALAGDRFARVLVAGVGHGSTGLRVVRLTESGAADATFGASGVALVESASGGAASIPRSTLVLDPLDRIVVCHTRVLDAGGGRVAVVARLAPDGDPDLDFGVQGEVVLAPAADATDITAVSALVDPLGAVVVCARELLAAGGSRVLVARFDESGTLDPSFGDGGIARGPEDDALALCMTLDPAGRVVVGGALGPEPAALALWRLGLDGLPDPGFGDAGLHLERDAEAAIGLRAVAVVADALGRIVALGERSHDLDEIDDWPHNLLDFVRVRRPVFDAIVWRFRADGSLDPAFGDGGARELAFNSGRYVSVTNGYTGGDHLDAAVGLTLDPLERIVVAGWSAPGLWDVYIGVATFGLTRPFLARLAPDGALDPSFHGDGHVQIGWDYAGIDMLRTCGHPTSFARDAAGRWLLAGDEPGASFTHVWRLVP